MHRKGPENVNAYALDPYKECDCYRAGLSMIDLPCRCCAYFRRVYNQWARFNNDVNEVIPLVVRSAELSDADQPTHKPET